MTESIIDTVPTPHNIKTSHRLSKKFVGVAMAAASLIGLNSNNDVALSADPVGNIAVDSINVSANVDLLNITEPADSNTLTSAVRNPNMPYPIVAAPIEPYIPEHINDLLFSRFVAINGCSGSQITQDIIVTAGHCVPYDTASQTVQGYLARAYPGGKYSGQQPITPTSIVMFSETDTALLVLNNQDPNLAVDNFFNAVGANEPVVTDGESLYFVGAPTGFEQAQQNYTPHIFEMAAIEGNDYTVKVNFGVNNSRPVSDILFAAGNLDQNGLGSIAGSSGALLVNANGEYIGTFVVPIATRAGRKVVSSETVTAESAEATVKYFASILKKVIYADVLGGFTKPKANATHSVITVNQ